MLNIRQEENGKSIITVPKGIRYISDWKEYSLNNFGYPHILDKKIPGCGYTEYCIRDKNFNAIITSPRITLLLNKYKQHPEDVFYFRNTFDDSDLVVDKDITKNGKHIDIPEKTKEQQEKENKERSETYRKLESSLLEYVNSCYLLNKPAKILVTYDSYRLVKEILINYNLFEYFHTIVDEFQSIFVDSRFKSSTEIEFLDQLQGVQKVCYVSATPMIDKYLKMINEFKDLPYFELDWTTEDPLRAIKPELKVRTAKSVNLAATPIIEDYKSGKFDKATYKDEFGNVQIIESREAVLYVNSVTNIISIIKKMGLKPEECNILCANTSPNRKKIKSRLGNKFDIGDVPLRGEPHKMFTFCTRTVYLGADFYSTCARTFILSDANIETLAVDITLDLPQILGRQRLIENPWKNRAEIYYRVLGKGKELKEEDFIKFLEKKTDKSISLLRSHESLKLSIDRDNIAELFERSAHDYNYKYDYVAVNKHKGSAPVPVFNDLVKISEMRAFEIQQVDYKDRFTVFNAMANSGLIDTQTSGHISKLLSDFGQLNGFTEKMRFVCEERMSDEERCVFLDQIPLVFKNYYLTLGPTRCKALSYHKTRIDREYLDAQVSMDNISGAIYSAFEVGKRYLRSDIKKTLGDIYTSLGMMRKVPKASDLEEWFDMKTCQVINKSTGKKDGGFEIISKKK